MRKFIEQDRTRPRLVAMYDSLEDKRQWLKSQDIEPWRVDCIKAGLNNPYWVGRDFASHAEAANAMNAEWPEGIRMVEEMQARLQTKMTLPRLACRKRKRRWREDDGDDLCLDRLRAGQAYWRSSRKEASQGSRLVTLFIPYNGLGSVSAEDLLWRGVAGVALATLLDKAGYRTEIYAVQHVRGCYHTTQHGEVLKGNADYLESVLVKSFASPLDRSTLTNAVSSWMFRTIGFLGRVAHEDFPGVDDGLGSSLAFTESEAELVAPNSVGRRFIISHVFSEHAAISSVTATCKSLDERSV